MKYQNGMYIWGEKYLTDYDGKEASLEIPDGMTEINAGAFAQCTQMPEKITIPDSVLKIEKYTFNIISIKKGTVKHTKVTVKNTPLSGYNIYLRFYIL